MYSDDYIEGYQQALIDIEKDTSFGSKNFQYYRLKIKDTTQRLRNLLIENFENGK